MKIRHFLLIVLSITILSCKPQKEKTEAASTVETKKTTKKEATAQPNVTVLEKEFEMPGLDRSRQIRIYLPPNYEKSDSKYPVLYMHDAQNLFDDATAYAGEWGIDESLNKLAKTQNLELIVIGIDNGGEKRMNELSPWKNKEFGNPEGEAYMDFIVKTIKPYIDSNYRTLTDKDHTAILGSSMGGLISHYAIYKYPEIFGKAGIFSPSYWFSEEVFSFTKDNPVPHDSRLYLLVGKKEGPNMHTNTQKMYDQIVTATHPKKNISVLIDPEGEHNEAFWKKHFPTAILWLFKS
ncbi:alpha/beta hydrolase-fold protein [Aquimarina sp. MMG016]|uniref:alpha/beta hydrolase n=1 Tax=Aquimarina sp. MMG016 TaxID=2822690 RepID=UPI001B39D302|nr:alpha/beta hydrolase-fold protein [Aquimarina sp. MMG016]MBQ4818515.1 alpha/beta hydrolase [Aquimarina sp. MMG016]